MKSFIYSSLALSIFMAKPETASSADSWDKVFKKSDKVVVEKVPFKNRYGIKLVGDLYKPKNLKKIKNYQL